MGCEMNALIPHTVKLTRHAQRDRVHQDQVLRASTRRTRRYDTCICICECICTVTVHVHEHEHEHKQESQVTPLPNPSLHFLLGVVHSVRSFAFLAFVT
jgi:hypothetical protein